MGLLLCSLGPDSPPAKWHARDCTLMCALAALLEPPWDMRLSAVALAAFAAMLADHDSTPRDELADVGDDDAAAAAADALDDAMLKARREVGLAAAPRLLAALQRTGPPKQPGRARTSLLQVATLVHHQLAYLVLAVSACLFKIG